MRGDAQCRKMARAPLRALWLVRENLAQVADCLANGSAHRGFIGKRSENHEVMDRAVVAHRRNWYAGLGQLTAVRFALVTQDVVLVDEQQRRRQAAELLDRS